MMTQMHEVRGGYVSRFIVSLFMMMISVQLYGQTDTVQTNVPALKSVYAHDFYIGCLLSYRNIGFSTDPPVTGQSAVVTPYGGSLIRFHMNSMSPGNNMKPQYTVDIAGSAAAYTAASGIAKDSINTHPIVKFNGDLIAQLNWAQRQGFTFRGHTLVWHSQTPAEFFFTGYSTSNPRVTRSAMIDRMDNYFHEVFRLIHEGWPGLLSAIDVVNEAIDDGTGKVRTTGNDWFTTFGDTTYVMKAFQLARQYTTLYGENQIKLYYNDYNTHVASKADGIVRLLTPIFQAGYLDGIGMQEHDANATPTAADWIATYNKFSPICTEMAVTELDVTTGSASPSGSVLAAQANQYGQLFKCFVERSYKSGRGKIINVSKDGLNDQYTFKTNQSSSLWDSHNQCKPSFFAAANVGINYNALDSLITYAGTLSENEYTPATWSLLAAALTSANAAKARNYSASVSADTALDGANDSLQAALAGLVKTVSGVDVVDGPHSYSLSQNYPNPFNPTTVVRYSVPEVSHVRLVVYDLLGREVGVLVNERKQPGTYTVRFDASGVASGVYIYRMETGSYSASKKLVVVK